jgi:predicted RNase H-like nuclease (RuvC/YqgF family)
VKVRKQSEQQEEVSVEEENKELKTQVMTLNLKVMALEGIDRQFADLKASLANLGAERDMYKMKCERLEQEVGEPTKAEGDQQS